ncbi:MAG TPA: DUF6166 domain-containing protein [Thermoleophilaceae bacterium]|jgi:hypothetical protein
MTAVISHTVKPMEATRYVGMADWWGRHVWLERGGARSSLPYRGDDPLATFAWGRRGIGARELSRAILHDATGSVALADRLCRDFTHEVVSELPEVGFELDREQVLGWLAGHRAAA